jgi:molybdate transport system ATP-binding protein
MIGATLEARVRVSRSSGFGLDARVSAAQGEVVAIMGPSGAGKSTLLSVIAGLLRVTDSSVRIDGTEMEGRHPVPPERRGVVLLGQDPRLFPHLTARDNVAFGPRAQGSSRVHAARAADEWLWRVGLAGVGHHRPDELSGGQQQRVALARALITSPKVLLLDEPLTSLDSETAGDIRALLHDQLHHTGMTAIVVTHDAVDAASLASRLMLIEDGAITQEGSVRSVLAAPSTRFAAATAGLNRLQGVARGGAWWADGGAPAAVLDTLDAASRAAARVDGSPLAALVRPSAVRVEHAEEVTWTGALRISRMSEPEHGTWLARVVRLEQTPAGARVHTAEPALAADMPADAVAEQRLAPGAVVRVTVPASAVKFVPA